MTSIEALITMYVGGMSRAYHQRTRGIVTPEMRQAWEKEAREAIARVEAEAAVKALREVAESYVYVAAINRTNSRVHAFLRDRADRIAREAGIDQEDTQ